MNSFEYDVPVVDLDVRHLIAEVGPERFWNAEDPVLTHLFNAVIYTEKYAIEYTLSVVSEVLQEHKDLDIAVRKRLSAYQEQANLSQKQNNEHLQLLHSQGYEDKVEAMFARWHAAEDRKPDLKKKLSRLNAYCWLSNSVCEFLLGNHWFLSRAALKPAVMFRWRSVVDAIHNRTGFLLCQAFHVRQHTRIMGMATADLRSKMSFARQFFYMLHKDGCFRLSALPVTLKKLFILFLKPVSGYEWLWIRYRLLYFWSRGNARVLDNRALIVDFLMNYQSFLRQVNPAVDDAAFFSGAYFQNER